MSVSETGRPNRGGNLKFESPLAELLEQVAREVVRRLKKRRPASNSATPQERGSRAAKPDGNDEGSEQLANSSSN